MNYVLIIFSLITLNSPLMSQEKSSEEKSTTISQQQKPVKLTFALVPQQSASKLAKKWIPIFKYLTAETGIELSFRTAPNIPAFEKNVADGKYDIAYMNPFHYTVFSKSPGYKAFAKAKNKRIKGILVTSKENPVTSFTELNNKTLAFPAPAAFAATLLTQAALNNNKIDFNAKYVSSHDSVYHNVAKGIYPAGGGILRTFGNVAPAIKEKLQVFYTTDGYTPHAFAAHPDADQKAIMKIQQAMIAMENNDKGNKLLKSVNIKGLESANDSDWNDVRQLNINVKLD